MPESHPAPQSRPGTFSTGSDARRNTNGRGKGRVPRLSDGRTLNDLAREYTQDALNVTAKIMLDETETADLRLKAASVLLQRGWGDAPRAASLDVSVNVTNDVSMLSTEQIASRLNQLRDALALAADPTADYAVIDVESQS